MMQSAAPEVSHTASCLCGAVRLRIRGELAGIQLCHCGQCRKAQGGPFAAVVPVLLSAVEWIAGTDHVATYVSSPGKSRHFCRRCGSPLYSTREAQTDRIRLRAGLLDEPVYSQPIFHQHVDGQSSWWPIQDDLPRHAKGFQGDADSTRFTPPSPHGE